MHLFQRDSSSNLDFRVFYYLFHHSIGDEKALNEDDDCVRILAVL